MISNWIKISPHPPPSPIDARSVDAVKVIDDFRAATGAAAGPEPDGHFLVALVARLQLHRDAELVAVGRDVVGLDGVLQALHDLLVARQPALDVADEEGGRVVAGLEEILGLEARRRLGDGVLLILSAWLFRVTLARRRA